MYSNFSLTHMLLYLIMEPTITAVPPRMPTIDAMAVETLMNAVVSSENVFHS